MCKEFKIVKIIDDKTLVINAGYSDNIKEGDNFEIFEQGEEIRDPDTGENLGSLDLIKETVKAVNVFKKICICKHYIVTSYFSSITTSFLQSDYNTLNVDSTQISGGLHNDKIIRIGDKARKIKILEEDNNI